MSEYNYVNFGLDRELDSFLEFARSAPLVTMRAPDFALEDLDTGETMHLRDLWARQTVIVEFGSFT